MEKLKKYQTLKEQFKMNGVLIIYFMKKIIFIIFTYNKI